MQLHDHRRVPLANDGDKAAKPAQGLVAHSRSINMQPIQHIEPQPQLGHARGGDKEPHIGDLDYRVELNMLPAGGCH